MFHVTESNKLEGLLHTFKQLAFRKGTNPFAKRIVLVPSGAFKSYLRMDLANDLKIAFGLDLYTYEEGLVHLSNLFLGALERRVPSLLDLTLRIQAELLLNPEDVQHFLKGVSGGPLEKKLYFLSKNLARLFLNYSRFSEKPFTEENFQTRLFQKIFCEESPWITRIDLLKREVIKKQEAEIFVFAPFMTRSEVDFLKRISQVVSVEVFNLMPSSYLLDDQLTDREEAKQGDLFERNSFIGNYSMLFRETQRNIIDHTDLVSGVYLVEAFAEEIDEWKIALQSDHMLVGDKKMTLLKAFQTDLTLLRMCEEKIAIDDAYSIELHAAPSRFREVQILHNQLLGMVSQGIKPIDIQVFAKDILPYEPYIKAVFGNGPLKFIIQGEKTHENPFLEFLELSFKCFEAQAIVSLLECAAFRKKAGISPSDVQNIRSYIDEEAFTWGENLEEKNSYLKDKGFEKGSQDAKGTLEDFERRLVTRFVMDSSIDIVESDCIASMFKLLNSLKKDLPKSKEKRPFSEWLIVVKDLFEKYFEGEFPKFTISDPVVLTLECHFMTAYLWIQDAMKKNRGREKEEDLNGIRFSSLLPHHACPSKVIALIGLEDGVFPARDPQDSLDLLKGTSFMPKNSDVDRFLFMEAILSARETLYLSYAKNDEKAPSKALTDLIDYLQKAFVTDISIQEHYDEPYHPEYFSELNNHSEVHFNESNAHLNQEMKPRAFLGKGHLAKEPKMKIEIKDLVNFFKNPIKAYLQNASLYISQHEEDNHPLELPKKEFYDLKRAFFEEEETFRARMNNLAKMPPKLFGELKKAKIFRERKQALELTGSQNIFTLNFLPYESPDFTEESLVHTSGITVGERFIFGKIENVSDKGLIRFSSASKLKDLMATSLELTIARKKFPDMSGSKEVNLGSLVDIYVEGMKRPLLLMPDWLIAIRDGDVPKLTEKIRTSFNPFQETQESLTLNWAYGSAENISPEDLIQELQPYARAILEPLESEL